MCEFERVMKPVGVFNCYIAMCGLVYFCNMILKICHVRFGRVLTPGGVRLSDFNWGD